MLELKFDDNSPSNRMDVENPSGFLSSEDNNNDDNSSMEELKKSQNSMNIHNQFQSIFKFSFEKLVKRPDIKNLEKLLEVYIFSLIVYDLL